MKLSNFVHFNAPAQVDIGDVIVFSNLYTNDINMFLVTGIFNGSEYNKYQIVNLNNGRVVYEIDAKEHELFEIWEYFSDYELEQTYNIFVIDNNNIVMSFEEQKDIK